jgi:putative heme-binding domain-containing protein
MPPFAQIGEPNIEAVVSYLRDLQGERSSVTASEIVLPGDADTGHALFFGKAQCSSCHMVHGEGGFIAANLSAYGRNRTPDAIWRAITNPDNPLVRSSRVATITTSKGQKLTGVLRNEDSFTVELQTENGRYYMFVRKDLSDIQYTDHSLMPQDYRKRLRPKELDDIVSFLVVAAGPQEKTEGRDH